MTTRTQRKPFTGRHMTAILVAGFGVVLAVNVTMASLASSTFGGIVVENSYVASQHFNRWLGEAEREKALAGRIDAARREDGRVAARLGLAHPILRQAQDERSGGGMPASDTAARGQTPPSNPAQAELVEAPAAPAAVTAIARHPLGRLADVALTFREQPGGGWVSEQQLPAGRWTLRFEVEDGARTWRAEEPLTAGPTR